MPVPKGTRIGGRQKGTPNKSTASAREAIALFIEGNAYRLQIWLDEIAKKDPKAAYDCVLDLMEYHVPKLARTEIASPEGSALSIHIMLSDKGKP
jgi:hypothetical protein